MKRLLAMLPLAACGTAGAFHQISLAGQCAEGDAACSRRHPIAPIAIGARFHPEVATELDGTTTPNLRLESAAPDIIEVDGDALVGRREGAAAVLITTDDGSVVDFVHVWVAPITRVSLARRDGERVTDKLGLTVGEDVTLVPALWSGPQRLAGDAEIQWRASATAPVAILRDGTTDRRRLRARAPGATTITVAIADATATVDLEVVP